MDNTTGLFGKFNGIKVYKTTLPSYVGNKYYDDEVNMYLIEGDLIYKNQIIGRWDGKMVHEWDPHERSVFYRKTVKKETKKKEPETKPTEVIVEPTYHKAVEVATADAAIASVYNTDYSQYCANVDAFLKEALYQ